MNHLFTEKWSRYAIFASIIVWLLCACTGQYIFLLPASFAILVSVIIYMANHIAIQYHQQMVEKLPTSSLKEILLTAPESQLDPQLFPLINKWGNHPTSLQILEIIDLCIHSSLCSGFLLSILQLKYDEQLAIEGKRHDDNLPLATWRNI